MLFEFNCYNVYGDYKRNRQLQHVIKPLSLKTQKLYEVVNFCLVTVKVCMDIFRLCDVTFPIKYPPLPLKRHFACLN